MGKKTPAEIIMSSNGTTVKKNPKILFISNYLPEGGAGGGVILRDLLLEYPEDKLFWAAMYGPFNYSPVWKKSVGRHYFPFPKLGRYSQYWKLLEVKYVHRVFVKAYIRRLKRIINIWKPDLIWGVIQKLTVPLFSSVCETFSNIPIHISIHDDPILENTHHAFPFREIEFRNKLRIILNRTRSIDAVSNRLLKKYATERHLSAVVTRGADWDKSKIYFAKNKSVKSGVRVVLGGQGQCPSPWPQDLIRGFEAFEEKKCRNSSFHAYDIGFRGNDKNVFAESLISPSKFDEAMKTYHLGYICDPLNDYGKAFALTSFSTKLVTYVTHGLPFIYHGPQNSTAADFLEKFPAGVIVESHDPEDIKDAFGKLVDNFASAREACRIATLTDLNIDNIRNRLFEIIT